MSDLEILNELAEIERQRHKLRLLMQEIADAQRMLVVLAIWVTAGAVLIATWM